MFDTQALQTSLTQAVRDAVSAEADKLRNGIDANALIVSTLEKPILSFPDDVEIVLGSGRTTVFELAKDPQFPPRIEVGRKRFIKTATFMAWLDQQIAA